MSELEDSEFAYTADWSKRNKLKDTEIIQPRVKVRSKLWRVFKGVIDMEGMRLHVAVGQALTLWMDNISTVRHKCDICESYVNDYNYYCKVINGEYIYYCSLVCLNRK